MQVACANFIRMSSIVGKYPTIFYFFLNFFASFDMFGTIFAERDYNLQYHRKSQTINSLLASKILQGDIK